MWSVSLHKIHISKISNKLIDNDDEFQLNKYAIC